MKDFNDNFEVEMALDGELTQEQLKFLNTANAVLLMKAMNKRGKKTLLSLTLA
jgi:hypothetical protein